MSELRDVAMQSKAWPFEEARALLKRLGGKDPEKGHVLFETGYGPSGLPHIGTFGEVLRTTMIRRAFEVISDIPTRLVCFSDDLDGMRKVPENVPQQEMMHENLQRPLTSVPDPFGTHDSFGDHNNAMLRRFLDTFGFEYEFISATEFYGSGKFDDTLRLATERYDDIMAIMLKSLREERQQSYSCFLPIHPETGRVLYVPMKHVDAKAHTITFDDEDGREWTLPVTGGNVKLQWKPDFGARWAALGVDFEMYGKDHSTNTPIYDGICKVLGGRAPHHFTYELFLDDQGQKISKSKGNGLTMEEWLAYGPPDSLALFMYQKPKSGKRLYFDVIPRAVDDWLTFLAKYEEEDTARRLENPAWHIHAGKPPREPAHLSFNILLNLAGVANAEDKAVLWGFIARYAPKANPETDPILDRLVGHAIRYYQDFVKPAKQYRAPTGIERAALEDLVAELEKLPKGASAEDIQTQIYEVGKRHDFESLRHWFKACYEILLGQDQGPRLGSFIALYGIKETVALVKRALAGEDLAA